MNSFEKLKDFFDNREVAHKATKPLGKKAIGEVIFLEEPGKSYTFKKSGKFATLFEESIKKPDFTMKLSIGAVEDLVNFKSENVGDFGIRFFKLLKANEKGKEVEVKINIGFFRIVTKGYLKVLLLGGPIVKSVAKKVFSKK